MLRSSVKSLKLSGLAQARSFRTQSGLNQEIKKFNKYSAVLTEPVSQGASRAMLYATGFKNDDFGKGQVGVGSCWWSGNPCNMHLMDLNNQCTKSIEKANLKGMQFNTIGVSDGISMGTTGMRYSLQSREVIADSFETIMLAQHYDANVAIPSCDKNMPGVIMAMLRHNRPSIMVYGGTICQVAVALPSPMKIFLKRLILFPLSKVMVN